VISPQHRKITGFLEVAAAIGLFQFTMWKVSPLLENVTASVSIPLLVIWAAGLAYAFYISPVLIHRDPASVRGVGSWKRAFVRTDNLPSALWVFGGLALVQIALLVAGIALFSSARFHLVSWEILPLRLFLYLGSAAVQSLFWLSFVLVRLRALAMPDGLASVQLPTPPAQGVVCLCGALLFAVCHLPNPILMLWGFSACLFMSYFYLRVPNYVAAALCHALVGTSLSVIAGIRMRIGPFYSELDFYPIRNIILLLEKIIGGRW